MAYPYQKHIWVTREIIRREYLQNIEDGIYDEQQERLLQEAEIRQDIQDETDRATAEEDALSLAIQTEKTRAEGVESTLNNAISAERQRATAAESSLNSAITTETTRATGVENSLDTRISNEYTRATNAESTLSTNLQAETTRAMNAENALGTRVTTLEATATRAYKAAGSVLFADLPALAESRQGFVYNIRDDFTTTSDFIDGAGKTFPAGTDVAIVAVEGTPVTYKYNVMSGFVDTSDFVKNTDYATTSSAGIVKPDGVTTSIDANGVISATGGGPAVEKAYKTNDSASTTIDDTDYIPMSTSSETRKKTLITTLAEKVKSLIGNATTSIAGLMSASDKSFVGTITPLVTVPKINSSTLPSQSTDNETYFKEWLVYICQHYSSIIDSNKYICAIVNPNSQGNVYGHIYDATVIHATTKLPQYSSFIYTPIGDTVQIRFGTINYTWYFKSFRNPTGNATAAQVLSGYTFSNASSDGLTGTFSHTATKTPASSELNSSAMDLTAQHNYRYVNTAVCYAAGRKAILTSDFVLVTPSVSNEVIISVYLTWGNVRGIWIKPEGFTPTSSDVIEFLEWGTWNVYVSVALTGMGKAGNYYYYEFATAKVGLIRIKFPSSRTWYYHFVL